MRMMQYFVNIAVPKLEGRRKDLKIRVNLLKKPRNLKLKKDLMIQKKKSLWKQ
jgi:hypothetical protein